MYECISIDGWSTSSGLLSTDFIDGWTLVCISLLCSELGMCGASKGAHLLIRYTFSMIVCTILPV